jgi:hypothetical protein
MRQQTAQAAKKFRGIDLILASALYQRTQSFLGGQHLTRTPVFTTRTTFDEPTKSGALQMHLFYRWVPRSATESDTPEDVISAAEQAEEHFVKVRASLIPTGDRLKVFGELIDWPAGQETTIKSWNLWVEQDAETGLCKVTEPAPPPGPPPRPKPQDPMKLPPSRTG